MFAKPDCQTAPLAQTGFIGRPVGHLVALSRNMVAAILVQLKRHSEYPKVGKQSLLLRWAPPHRHRGIHAPRFKAPYEHWNTMTFIAALRHDRIDAVWVLDGPINCERLLLYIRRILAPTLQPKDIVTAGNLSGYKGMAFRQSILATDATLILLPNFP